MWNRSPWCQAACIITSRTGHICRRFTVSLLLSLHILLKFYLSPTLLPSCSSSYPPPLAFLSSSSTLPISFPLPPSCSPLHASTSVFLATRGLSLFLWMVVNATAGDEDEMLAAVCCMFKLGDGLADSIRSPLLMMMHRWNLIGPISSPLFQNEWLGLVQAIRSPLFKTNRWRLGGESHYRSLLPGWWSGAEGCNLATNTGCSH